MTLYRTTGLDHHIDDVAEGMNRIDEFWKLAVAETDKLITKNNRAAGTRARAHLLRITELCKIVRAEIVAARKEK